MQNTNSQIGETPQLAIEASAVETLRLSELWRNEPWAHIGSNTPYGIEKNDTEGEKNRLEARKAFIGGAADEPDLAYPQLDMVDLESAIVRFDAMITALGVQSKESPLLFQSISDKIAELSRHRYVLEAMQATTPEARDTYLGFAETLAVEVFGEVDPHHFNTLLSELRATASSNDTHYSQELLELLPEVDPSVEMAQQQTLKPETIAKLEPLLKELFAPAFAIIETLPDGEIEHDRSVEIFQQMIDALGLENVRAVLTSGNALSANGNEMTIGLGRNRAKMTKASFGMVGIHEMVHILGHYNGKKQTDDLLSIGLPGNLVFEEGKCVAVEQILNGKATKRGELYYLGLGLLKGTIDGKQRTFRDVYEILWRKSLLAKNEEITDEMVTKAQLSAYQTTMRITRGHAADTRDLAYYNGNDLASGWLNDLAELPTEESYTLLKATLTTRANPTNPAHRAYLEEHHPDWKKSQTMGAAQAKSLLNI